MKARSQDFHYGEPQPSPFHGALDRGLLTEQGLDHMLDCVIAMKEVLGDKIGLALDCGPGWMLPDAIRFARAVEKLQHHVARGHAHRRLRAVGQRRRSTAR